MKKLAFLLSVIAIIFCNILVASAEIIDVKDEERQFGDWKSFCKLDAMMSVMDCKIASKFYENNAVITIEPKENLSAKLNIVIPQVRIGESVKVRVDKNNLIQSKAVANKDFSSVPLGEEQKDLLYSQMLNGEFLYLRFNLRDTEKEITVKLSLKDFRNALVYADSNK